MRRLTLKTKFIVSLSTILLLGFVLTNLNNYRVSIRSVRKNIVEHALPLTRDNIYSEIQSDLMRPIFISSLMANDTFLKDWALGGEQDVDKITRYLQEIEEKYGFFSTFFVSEKTGFYYHFNGILKKISPADPHDVWYPEFKALNKSYDLVVDTNEAAENGLTIFINHRLNDYQGNLLGVTGVGLNMEMVANLLKSYRQRYGRDIYLVDQNGLIKVHKDQTLVDRENISDQEGLKEIARQALVVKPEPDCFDFWRDGRHILLTSRYIPEFEWFLFVEQDETQAIAGIRRNFYESLIFDLLIIVVVLGITIYTVNRFQNTLEEMATTDKLTGAWNRREFDRCFDMACYLSKRQGRPFSVVLFDVDDFKTINDELGHMAGDQVLKEVVRLADEHIRQDDLVVRWGGDEFVLLVHNDLAHARQVAERLREEICNRDLLNGVSGSCDEVAVTISCGVVMYDEGETLDHLMMRADAALYESKKQGKNQTVTLPAVSVKPAPSAI
ncbi:diguanylate cyclase [Syntrophotalea carbinolica DSM 2380]|uniref:diguanylate cyclase n=1 Tax=Syntrophotalea carbinolica (strain DSM 2380 / NBRC 103641 / GraBd1) TaxID=338963 RepID=Q3A1R9_SYNC1|nr:sensor domain-containing diguanylate cyclase [Syntrophotalea carbinolica]ABA89688.1 diguanylate cyclase [Syntrophotalea carbinolica DSM 2380]